MSQDELVDILNEQGAVIQTVPKKIAHEQGLLHKVVIAEIIDSRGRWLMIKQSSSKQDAGQYVSAVGGHVAAGESELDALKREALEEMGIAGEYAIKFAGKAKLNRFVLNRQENHLFLVYKIYSDAAPKLNEEVASFTYFTEDELKRQLQSHPEQFGEAFHFVVKHIFPQFLM